MDSHIPPTEHNMMIPDQQVFGRDMTIHRLKQLVTYQRLVSQESSYYVLLESYDYP
jgi:hypothetical protein